MTVSSDVLSTSLDAIKNAQARQRPIIMITCAPDGTFRVCVPDSGELRVLSDRWLRVAIWPDTPTAADLDGGAPVRLIVPDSPDVRLINATARGLDNAAMVWRHYDLTITSSRVATRGTAPFTRAVHSRSKRVGEDSETREEVLTGVPRKRLAKLLG